MIDLASKGRALARRGLRLFGSPRSSFDRFQSSIRKSTWKCHDSVLDWALSRADREDESSTALSTSPLVKLGWSLKTRCESEFRGKLKDLGARLRVLVHVPDFEVSPGGYSLFSSLISSLNFVGIPAAPLKWADSIDHALQSFHPSCFVTSDHESYLGKVNWDGVRSWKEKKGLLVGLTASLQEYGNSPLEGRLSWAKKNGIDFYYSFRSPEYVRLREEYAPFFEEGYAIFNIEFGANPSLHYPVEGVLKDLDYVFLASSNPDKHERYFLYLTRILKERHGFLDGPGWKGLRHYAPARTHKYLYSRGRVGLNLHIPDSILWPSELNERTYILAACGVPQVVDSALLLPRRFGSNCFFVGETPRQYEECFFEILEEPAQAEKKAARALEEVYSRHTTYHRVEAFTHALAASFWG